MRGMVVFLVWQYAYGYMLKNQQCAEKLAHAVINVKRLAEKQGDYI
jgi:hypothetical protein